MVLPLDHADQKVPSHLSAGIDDLFPVPGRALGNPEADHVHLALGKGIHLHGGRDLKQPGNVRRRGQLRIDGHGKPQLLLDEADLFIITGVAHPCDGLAVSRLSGDQAAQQIYLVLVGNGDQKIRFLHARLLLHPVAGGIAVDAHHIQEISHHPNLLLVRVDDRNLVSFLIELLGQNIAHLAAACDNDPHRSVLLPSFF